LKLEFEVLLVQPDFERIVQPFRANLEKLGIAVRIRTIDTSQYINRLRDFDFDMVVGSFGQSFSPGNEQRDFWGSDRAEEKGSRNIIGVSNPVIDDLIDKIIEAPDREHLVAATRALDRVLLWNYYVVPQWHVATYRIAYWDRFGQPKTRPKFGIPILTWWVDAEKERRLAEQGTERQ
jgi:microcin C transport system substrate-binding protein